MGAALRVIALVAVLGSTAQANKLAVGNVSAEPDVADEAGAITLLVRSGLSADDRAVIDAPADITVGEALVMLEKVDADHAVLMDLGRDGTKLRLTVVIVSRTVSPVVKVAQAGDGDVVTLAREALDQVTTSLGLPKTRIPPTSLGRLRPFAQALRLKTVDPAAAAHALARGNPSVTFAVPAIRTLLAGVPAGAIDPGTSAIAARAIGDRAQLDKIGEQTNEHGVAARALAAIASSDTAMAVAELGAKPPKTGTVAFVQAVLAELAGDRKHLDAAVIAGLAGDQAQAVLAFAGSVGSFEKPTLAALVAGAEKLVPNAPGVTSQIGIMAAAEGVEVARALALVNARELDDQDLKRLETLVATGSDATSLRLRAELALRRADDAKATVAIGTYASEAPNDPRSSLYSGWLYVSKGKLADAVKAFEKAGAPREMARALFSAGNWKLAISTIGGKPETPEEYAYFGRRLLDDGSLSEAEKALLFAEKRAPVSPVIQGVIAKLGIEQKNPERVRRAYLVGSIKGDIPIDTGPTKVIVGAGSQQQSPGSTPEKVVIDLQGGDPRILEPMLEALQIPPKSKIVLAQLGWSPSMFSFRQTNPELVAGALVKLLGAPPYDEQIIPAPDTLEGENVKLDVLDKLTGDRDGALVYRVVAKGKFAEITLLHYLSGATTATQVSRVVDMPGVVTFNTTKLIVIGVVAVIFVLLVILWITRSMGKIELRIDRAADADEALCVEISKNPKRPVITDMLEFHNATKAAGTISKARFATLIASGLTMKVPSGKWYVHLYGTYSRGGKLSLVPDACTREVDVKRGSHTELLFDLQAKLADVTIEVLYEKRGDVTVWANDELARRRPDGAHKVEVQLPVGNHIIHVKTPTDELALPLHIPIAKATHMGINVTRELRLMKDLDLGVDPEKASSFVIEMAQTPQRTIAQPPNSDPKVAMAKTQAVSADEAAAASAAAAGQRNGHARAKTPVPGEMLLDRYRITAELGRGAMGIVQRAWDEKLEREVAIKVMADDLRAIPEAMKLFTSEAKALAQLNHTNIVAMYDQITDADKVYMVMEFVDGQPLENLIAARGQMPWFEAVAIVDQVCAGLAYAHARKVIHRDIKPANIFVGNDKTVKLGDFGLARVMREVTIRRTEVRGTPLYMAPEQITGTNVDHRSDLYAVGCTLFELVTGRPPFIDGDILYAQMNATPPRPSSLAPELPKGVDDLILSLLQKDPDDRPGSAAEVRTSLRELSTV